MKARSENGREVRTRAVVLGPPGSGKGTQAELASRRFGLVRISTGDLLREAVRNDTPMGQRVRSLLEAGALVADEMMGEVVEERLRALDRTQGFLLDGFPRTLPQVDLLDRILERTGKRLDTALALEVEESEILRRLGGRRVCRSCDAVFHVASKPPREKAKCDSCGGEVAIRDDDRESVIRERLRVYRRETVPVVDCYRKRGLLRTVGASGSATEVSRRFQAELLEVGS